MIVKSVAARAAWLTAQAAMALALEAGTGVCNLTHHGRRRPELPPLPRPVLTRTVNIAEAKSWRAAPWRRSGDPTACLGAARRCAHRVASMLRIAEFALGNGPAVLMPAPPARRPRWPAPAPGCAADAPVPGNSRRRSCICPRCRGPRRVPAIPGRDLDAADGRAVPGAWFSTLMICSPASAVAAMAFGASAASRLFCPSVAGASMRSATKGCPVARQVPDTARRGRGRNVAVISAESNAAMMPSLSVVQTVPSRRRKAAPALSSPPKPRLPSSSPCENT